VEVLAALETLVVSVHDLERSAHLGKKYSSGGASRLDVIDSYSVNCPSTKGSEKSLHVLRSASIEGNIGTYSVRY
jgi:hypothetical protein